MSPRKGPFQKQVFFKPIFLRGRVCFLKNTVYIVTLLKASAIRRDMITININFVRKLLEKVTIFAKFAFKFPPAICCLLSKSFFATFLHMTLKPWQCFHFGYRSLERVASRWSHPELGSVDKHLFVSKKITDIFVFACIDLWVFVEDNVLAWWTIEELITLSQEGFSPSASYLIPLFFTTVLTIWVQLHISYISWCVMNNTKKSRLSSSVEVEKFLSKSKFFKQSQSLIGGFNPLENIMLVKLDHFCKERDETLEHYVKPLCLELALIAPSPLFVGFKKPAKFFRRQKSHILCWIFFPQGRSTCVGNIPKRFFRNPTRWAPKSPVMK